jgi:hypothetical protein
MGSGKQLRGLRLGVFRGSGSAGYDLISTPILTGLVEVTCPDG